MAIEHQNVNIATEFVLEGLTSICGEANLSADSGVLVVAPANANEISDVLKYAGEHGLTVSSRGSSTKASWMGTKNPDVILSTHRMNTVTEHVWQDMTCTVGAGCTWAAMQAALAKHSQCVALDPLWPEQATIAGVVSTNDSGAMRMYYGGLRDLLIGLTLVLPDGTIAKSGGKVVKNVAGYDLQKLLCGAYGTIAVIAELTFRLHALPSSFRSYSISSSSAKPLGEVLLKILDSHLSTKAMQLRTSGEEGYTLDVRLSALEQVLDAQRETLVKMAQTFGLTVQDAEENNWSARQQLFDSGDAIRFKATLLPSSIAEMSEQLARMGGSAVTQAHGIMFGSIDVSKAAELSRFRTNLNAAGGSLSFLGALPTGERDRWGIAPATLHWMNELKHRFDPAGMLNPGCFAEEV